MNHRPATPPPAGGPERTLRVVLPGDAADPGSPSGGNVYDLRVCAELSSGHGWHVRRTDLPGGWPRPDAAARAGLAGCLDAAPDGAVVLVDGLVACGVPDIIVPAAARLRLAVLVHLPLADETGLEPEPAARLAAGELATLLAARAVLVTSPSAAQALVARGLDPARVHVAEPGVDRAPLARGTDGVGRLLCAASVTPRKGQLELVEALAELAHRPWTLICAGPLDRDPRYVTRLRDRIAGLGLDRRVLLVGPLARAQLDEQYAEADLLVLPSRAETYGMVVTEALARGVPVLASAVGALPTTLGHAPDGSRPGLLVEPGDHRGLVATLTGWLSDAPSRDRLRTSARQRGAILVGWEQTAGSVHVVLDRMRRWPVVPS